MIPNISKMHIEIIHQGFIFQLIAISFEEISFRLHLDIFELNEIRKRCLVLCQDIILLVNNEKVRP